MFVIFFVYIIYHILYPIISLRYIMGYNHAIPIGIWGLRQLNYPLSIINYYIVTISHNFAALHYGMQSCHPFIPQFPLSHNFLYPIISLRYIMGYNHAIPIGIWGLRQLNYPLSTNHCTPRFLHLGLFDIE